MAKRALPSIITHPPELSAAAREYAELDQQLGALFERGASNDDPLVRHRREQIDAVTLSDEDETALRAHHAHKLAAQILGALATGRLPMRSKRMTSKQRRSVEAQLDTLKNGRMPLGAGVAVDIMTGVLALAPAPEYEA
jgi:hypothetical protein